MDLFDLMNSDEEDSVFFNKPRVKNNEILGRCTALYDYDPGSEEEISMKEGELYELLSKEGNDLILRYSFQCRRI